jgi:hypothetical protein
MILLKKDQLIQLDMLFNGLPIISVTYLFNSDKKKWENHESDSEDDVE